MRHLSLPGILRIGYVATEKLSPRIMWKSLAGIPIGLFADVTEVAILGEALCEADSTADNNGRVEKTTLSFTTLDTLPDDDRIAWVVECVNGKKYLIGTRSAPYPTMKTTITTGTASGNSSVTSVEITHMAVKSLIEITV